MSALIARIRNEPALVVAFVIAVLGFVTRSKVSPVEPV